MKFLNLDRENFDWIKTLTPAFENKHFINGEQVKQFEEALAHYVGTTYAIGVSSGTAALEVALIAWSILHKKNTGTVLTTPYTFVATGEVPYKLGFNLKFCDIDRSFNLDYQQVYDEISTGRVDVFLPVHLFGQAFKLDTCILDLCANTNTTIIEDAAQALGARVGIQRVGSLGNVGCFSFFPSKNLGCAGDGGAITTNDPKLYELCVALREHGRIGNSYHYIGGNYRLDTIQAAILLAKLPYLNSFIEGRRQTANYYNEALGYNSEQKDLFHTYNQYVINVSNRNTLKLDFPHAIYYPKLITDQPCFKTFSSDFPIAHSFTKTNLALPIAHITEKERNRVVSCLLQL